MTVTKSDFYQIDEILTSLGTGEALITVLNDKGIPTEVVATHLTPPKSIMGPLTSNALNVLMSNSDTYKKYQEIIDPESAYEILSARINQKIEEENNKINNDNTINNKNKKSTFEKVIDAPITRQIGREIVRGLFGIITGKKSTRKSGGLFGF